MFAPLVRFRYYAEEFQFPQTIHTSSYFLKNTRSGVVRRTRNMSEPLTYEQAKKPHQIGVLKSWNSWNTANLHNEDHYTGIVTWHDSLIRLFIRGTFPTHILSEIIIRRQANMVHICFNLSNRLSANEIYFLVGYGEQMLSYLLRCPVKIEPRMILNPKDVIFRYI
ncbi:conserved hypothetical protein [Echinococcus multilocularis]|uniref:28S ribosomal protein S24 mitochondrial n=1 Tax=Echinococcus multilocularis TaxID=6211 RepID=A0A068XUT3_ECHMU|nr:conserved hypothetical protein [Echinococcus multilocularis]